MLGVPGIIDTHAHYDDEQFDADREALLSALPGEKLCEEMAGKEIACEKTACEKMVCREAASDSTVDGSAINASATNDFAAGGLVAAEPAASGKGMEKERHSYRIEAVVNVGASLSSCRRALGLAERYERVYAAVGVHPDEVGELELRSIQGCSDEKPEQGIDLLRSWAAGKKVVAIGEIGLDYYWDKADRSLQEKWFRAQLRLAKELGLPVNIHSRDAAADTWRIMKEERLEEIGGIIHCYSYSWEMAEQYLDAGFYLGIGGVVTFKNAKKLKAVVRRAPLERLVLETDCPYLAPEPYRGKRNCSAYLTYVAEKIAEIKELETEEVIRQTTQNARTVYRKLSE